MLNKCKTCKKEFMTKVQLCCGTNYVTDQVPEPSSYCKTCCPAKDMSIIYKITVIGHPSKVEVDVAIDEMRRNHAGDRIIVDRL